MYFIYIYAVDAVDDFRVPIVLGVFFFLKGAPLSIFMVRAASWGSSAGFPVDGWNPARKPTWDVKKNPVNHGIFTISTG